MKASSAMGVSVGVGLGVEKGSSFAALHADKMVMKIRGIKIFRIECILNSLRVLWFAILNNLAHEAAKPERMLIVNNLYFLHFPSFA